MFGTIEIPKAQYNIDRHWLKRTLEVENPEYCNIVFKTGVTVTMKGFRYLSGNESRYLIISGHVKVLTWSPKDGVENTKAVLKFINTGL